MVIRVRNMKRLMGIQEHRKICKISANMILPKKNLGIHHFFVLKVNSVPCHFLLDTSPGNPYASAAY